MQVTPIDRRTLGSVACGRQLITPRRVLLIGSFMLLARPLLRTLPDKWAQLTRTMASKQGQYTYQ